MIKCLIGSYIDEQRALSSNDTIQSHLHILYYAYNPLLG